MMYSHGAPPALWVPTLASHLYPRPPLLSVVVQVRSYSLKHFEADLYPDVSKRYWKGRYLSQVDPTHQVRQSWSELPCPALRVTDRAL